MPTETIDPKTYKTGGGGDWYGSLKRAPRAPAVPSQRKPDDAATSEINTASATRETVPTERTAEVPREAVVTRQANTDQSKSEQANSERVITERPHERAQTAEVVKTEAGSGAGGADVSAESDTGKGQRIVDLLDDKTLIRIPGQKPKTVKQLKFEQEQASRFTRENNELDFERRKIQREKDDLKRERASIAKAPAQAISAQVTSERVTTEATVKQTGEKPVRPKDAMPGDPEYDEYLIKLGAFEARSSVQPLLDDLEARRAKEAGQEQLRREHEDRLRENQRIYTDGLADYLPFEIKGLPERTVDQIAHLVNGRLEKVFRRDPRTEGHLIELTPDVMQVAIEAAFPSGSLPPGYTQGHTQGAAEEDVETDAIRALREHDGKPLVEKTKPEPLHDTGTGAVAAPNRKEVARAGGNWYSKLEGKEIW